MEVRLPNLIYEEKIGNKNIIKYLIERQDIIEYETINDSTIKITNNSLKIELIKNNNQDSDAEYSLVNTFRNNENLNEWIRTSKWRSHPKLELKDKNEINNSWTDGINYIEEDIENEKNGLRIPQISALFSILSHEKVSSKSSIIVMPTGTGKTETMLASLVAMKPNLLLVTVPSDALRDQLASKFIDFGLLKDFGVISPSCFYPVIGIIKSRFESMEELDTLTSKCNVLISTMNLLAGLDSIYKKRISEKCTHYFIDEAHHSEAPSWKNFRNHFSKNKVYQFTATPFRNDGNRINGKIIFNFPLRLAQEQGYYKKINFHPIRIFDKNLVDRKIAEKAVEILKQDIESGYNHILMARCSTKNRATEIFEIYKEYSDLNPTMIFTGIQNRNEIFDSIINRQNKIIVCVDMLGEGFDLPELKIAAFHDIKKSLPITLQLAGRFTRTKFDDNLGEASFIANIANLNVIEELDDLYAQDADWNILLSNKSSGEITSRLEFEQFIEGFKNFDNSEIPIQNLRPALSTVVYKNHDREWKYKEFIQNYGDFQKADFRFHDYNAENKVLILITAKKIVPRWGIFKDLYDLEWRSLIIYYNSDQNLIFINSSENSGMYNDVAKDISGENAELIKGLNVFKSFYNINRVTLHNVGLKEYFGKNISFRMMTGSNVEEALSLAEKQKGEKAFVFGQGFEDGNKVTHGSSYKGRIWTRLNGNIKELVDWCNHIGRKLLNPDIDANQILRETLLPRQIEKFPDKTPVMIDWDEVIYNQSEDHFAIKYKESEYLLYDCEVAVIKYEESKIQLLFSLSDDASFEVEYIIYQTDHGYNDYSFMTSEEVKICYGTLSKDLSTFLYAYPLKTWFADGSAIYGCDFIEYKHTVLPYKKDDLIDWDWNNVDLRKEGQGISPKLTDSIQYSVIEKLKKEDYTIIYDDDGKGEIADIVCIKENDDYILFDFFHLKYAIDGIVSNRISNFYEVCGQAQKSLHWKFKKGKEILEHLLRRMIKKEKGNECSRIEIGSEEDLIRLLEMSKMTKPIMIKMHIVQPGASKKDISSPILQLLAVTKMYLKEVGNVELDVIVNK